MIEKQQAFCLGICYKHLFVCILLTAHDTISQVGFTFGRMVHVFTSRIVITGFIIAVGLIPNMLWAQNRMTREEYIKKYSNIAIENMRSHKIPASITLAQGILESGDGNSELAKKSNNHFGIKCHSDWSGDKTYHDDDKKRECFRVYKSVLDSYADHAKFLHKQRYAKCFELEITDYKGWAHALKDAGYATSPKYPKQLIKIIEDYKLFELDQIALGNSNKNKPNENIEFANQKYDTNDVFDDIDIYSKPIVKLSANKIKYIEANQGDTPETIAKKMDMGIWQIRKYNDIDKHYIFGKNEVVYLQPKRARGSSKYHVVKHGDSLWSISQQYGIRMKKIRKYNGIQKGERILLGQKLRLQ